MSFEKMKQRVQTKEFWQNTLAFTAISFAGVAATCAIFRGRSVESFRAYTLDYSGKLISERMSVKTALIVAAVIPSCFEFLTNLGAIQRGNHSSERDSDWMGFNVGIKKLRHLAWIPVVWANKGSRLETIQSIFFIEIGCLCAFIGVLFTKDKVSERLAERIRKKNTTPVVKKNDFVWRKLRVGKKLDKWDKTKFLFWNRCLQKIFQNHLRNSSKGLGYDNNIAFVISRNAKNHWRIAMKKFGNSLSPESLLFTNEEVSPQNEVLLAFSASELQYRLFPTEKCKEDFPKGKDLRQWITEDLGAEKIASDQLSWKTLTKELEYLQFPLTAELFTAGHFGAVGSFSERLPAAKEGAIQLIKAICHQLGVENVDGEQSLKDCISKARESYLKVQRKGHADKVDKAQSTDAAARAQALWELIEEYHQKEEDKIVKGVLRKLAPEAMKSTLSEENEAASTVKRMMDYIRVFSTYFSEHSDEEKYFYQMTVKNSDGSLYKTGIWLSINEELIMETNDLQQKIAKKFNLPEGSSVFELLKLDLDQVAKNAKRELTIFLGQHSQIMKVKVGSTVSTNTKTYDAFKEACIRQFEFLFYPLCAYTLAQTTKISHLESVQGLLDIALKSFHASQISWVKEMISQYKLPFTYDDGKQAIFVFMDTVKVSEGFEKDWERNKSKEALLFKEVLKLHEQEKKKDCRVGGILCFLDPDRFGIKLENSDSFEEEDEEEDEKLQEDLGALD